MYAERDKVLSGANLRENIEEMILSELTGLVSDHLGDRRPEAWDVDELDKDVSAVLPPIEGFVDAIDDESLEPGEIETRLHQHASGFYDRVEQGVTPEVMREVERRLMLRSVDANWVQHLTAMENLRQGIGLHAYGQRDPLVMYKKEGHEQFQALQAKIEHDIVHSIFRVQGVDPSAQAGQTNGGRQQSRPGRAAQPPQNKTIMSNVIDGRQGATVPAAQKVGRNQACPCGSGKKYKRCHGA
jgi:preprotein translocase subunit SecA